MKSTATTATKTTTKKNRYIYMYIDYDMPYYTYKPYMYIFINGVVCGIRLLPVHLYNCNSGWFFCSTVAVVLYLTMAGRGTYNRRRIQPFLHHTLTFHP